MSIEEYITEAERGSAEAQYKLGVCYCNGDGLAKDLVEGAKWFRKSAEQGNPKAQYVLGRCYFRGEGVKKNLADAVTWCRKAAENGLAEAQCMLGFCYARGEGVEENISEAINWWRKAADQGNATAQCNLGVSYFNGFGVEKDLVEAVNWWHKAAEQGEDKAQSHLGFCYYNGKGVEKDPVEAVKWYRRAAELGNADAQDGLGSCYDDGVGVEKDPVEAVSWWRKAVESRATSDCGPELQLWKTDALSLTLTPETERTLSKLDEVFASWHNRYGNCRMTAVGHVDLMLLEEGKGLTTEQQDRLRLVQCSQAMSGQIWRMARYYMLLLCKPASIKPDFKPVSLPDVCAELAARRIWLTGYRGTSVVPEIVGGGANTPLVRTDAGLLHEALYWLIVGLAEEVSIRLDVKSSEIVTIILRGDKCHVKAFFEEGYGPSISARILELLGTGLYWRELGRTERTSSVVEVRIPLSAWSAKSDEQKESGVDPHGQPVPPANSGQP